ncbi:MAG: DUF3857 domain-containing protein [Terracidiphilus sp.]
MHSSLWLHVLLLALVSPATLLAQFQQPTDEELKMTADPKAPGAAAVYLYREEITNDLAHELTFYVRIKVLSEKGKELATVRIPYFPDAGKVTDIQAHTIHSDGTVIPYVTKPDDLVDFKTRNFQENSVVFNLPSVEVGSILEYRLRYARDTFAANPAAPTWWIQQPYFVHKAHYAFSPLVFGSRQNLIYASRIDSDAQVVRNKRGDFILDITDVPPLPSEEWMPPLNTIKWRVEFYYTQFNSGKEFWETTGKRWADWIQTYTSPTNSLKNIVSEIVAPGDTDEQKARKIYAAVQKLDNSSFNRKSDVERKKEHLKEAVNVEDTWKQQSGDMIDIARLYIALARAAGLQVWPMRVVDRSHNNFDAQYLSLRPLGYLLAVVVIDGKDVYLDPGDKMCPYGLLHWKYAGAGGIRFTGKKTIPDTTPETSYKDSTVQRVANLYIDENGGVKGDIHYVMTGQYALHWRQLALQFDQDEVKKRFAETLENSLPLGVQASFDHFLALDDYTVNLIAVVNVSGNIGTATGKRLFLPGSFFEYRAAHPFVAQDKRVTPIDVLFAKTRQDSITYHLPPSFTIENVPPPVDVAWPGRATLKISFQATADSVQVSSTMATNFTVLDPGEYNDLRGFYQKVAAADQAQLVLTKSPVAPVPAPPAPKGN